MKDKNKFISSTVSELQNALNPNSIVGSPVQISDSVTIIPVSKITTVYLGGGGEYGEVKLFAGDKTHPFAGGVGTVVNMAPCGFFIFNNGACEFIKVPLDITETMFEKSTELLKKALNYES
ncbi:MAG: hypothetical protein IKL82_04355 [Clostridia bacterium]|nr:hypothetical protein [Clostridia bacterium]